MKKILDAVFLLLPPIVGTILIVILLGSYPSTDKLSLGLIIVGPVLSFLGVPVILFNKIIANWSAHLHSFWHPLHYKEEGEEEEGFRLDDENRKSNFRPTKFSYAMSLISGIIIYALGLIMIFLEISILRMIL